MTDSTESRPLMKDGLGPRAVHRLALALQAADARFPRSRFERAAVDGLDTLELKDRVRHLVRVLQNFLPKSVQSALPMLRAARAAWPEAEPEDDYAMFAPWPLIEWVPAAGVDEFEASMTALHDLTGLFTAEFAIRPFLEQDPARSLQILAQWARDEDADVRRLVSEGTRPRLPWAPRLTVFDDDYEPIVALLEALRDDPSESVRRSVANHLNDIAKDRSEMVVELTRRWSEGAPEPRLRLIRHALRSLIKQGDLGAMAVLGFETRPKVEASLEVSPKRLVLGGSLLLKVGLRSTSRTPQRLVVDFAIAFKKANGELVPKVFKLKTVELAPGETLTLEKRHRIAPATTRRYYGGQQGVELLVAGQGHAEAGFHLQVPSPRG